MNIVLELSCLISAPPLTAIQRIRRRSPNQSAAIEPYRAAMLRGSCYRTDQILGFLLLISLVKYHAAKEIQRLA